MATDHTSGTVCVPFGKKVSPSIYLSVDYIFLSFFLLFIHLSILNAPHQPTSQPSNQPNSSRKPTLIIISLPPIRFVYLFFLSIVLEDVERAKWQRRVQKSFTIIRLVQFFLSSLLSFKRQLRSILNTVLFTAAAATVPTSQL